MRIVVEMWWAKLQSPQYCRSCQTSHCHARPCFCDLFRSNSTQRSFYSFTVAPVWALPSPPVLPVLRASRLSAAINGTHGSLHVQNS
jgi:hypothetical protein